MLLFKFWTFSKFFKLFQTKQRNGTKKNEANRLFLSALKLVAASWFKFIVFEYWKNWTECELFHTVLTFKQLTRPSKKKKTPAQIGLVILVVRDIPAE